MKMSCCLSLLQSITEWIRMDASSVVGTASSALTEKSYKLKLINNYLLKCFTKPQNKLSYKDLTLDNWTSTKV